MKAIAIINPQSGNYNLEYLKSRLLDEFQHLDIELFETSETDAATSMAQKALLKNPDIIIACGGDGTISQIIQVVLGTDITIGIVPAGTGNLLALNLGISPNIDKAIEIIKKGKIAGTDIGIINNRIFASLAGCGFDAHIMGQTTPEKKKAFGAFAYFLEGFKYALESPHVKFKLVIDGKKTVKTKAIAVLIANKAHIFGEYLSIVPKNLHNDGKLDVVILSPLNLWGYVKIVFRFFTKRHYQNSRRIKYFQAEKIEISSNSKLFAQADGDVIGYTPVKAEIIKEAVKIFVPEEKYNISAELLEETFKKIVTEAIKRVRVQS